MHVFPPLEIDHYRTSNLSIFLWIPTCITGKASPEICPYAHRGFLADSVLIFSLSSQWLQYKSEQSVGILEARLFRHCLQPLLDVAAVPGRKRVIFRDSGAKSRWKVLLGELWGWGTKERRAGWDWIWGHQLKSESFLGVRVEKPLQLRFLCGRRAQLFFACPDADALIRVGILKACLCLFNVNKNLTVGSFKSRGG